MEQFDYLNSCLSTEFNEKVRVRHVEMFEREVRERAMLMHHLKVPAQDAVARIRQNIQWEFDDAWTTKLPSIHEKIDEIVAAVYGHLEGKRD